MEVLFQSEATVPSKRFYERRKASRIRPKRWFWGRLTCSKPKYSCKPSSLPSNLGLPPGSVNQVIKYRLSRHKSTRLPKISVRSDTATAPHSMANRLNPGCPREVGSQPEYYLVAPGICAGMSAGEISPQLSRLS